MRVNTPDLEGSFVAIGAQYGTIDAYLEQAGGRHDHRRAQLRTLLLEA